MKRWLLDTHIVLWWADDHPKLQPHVRDLIADSTNEIYLSAVSVWEVSIKARQGKLTLPAEPLEFFRRLVDQDDMTPLPIQFAHAAEVYRLPPIHNDPFDRLLIAQARTENMGLISADSVFSGYELPQLAG